MVLFVAFKCWSYIVVPPTIILILQTVCSTSYEYILQYTMNIDTVIGNRLTKRLRFRQIVSRERSQPHENRQTHSEVYSRLLFSTDGYRLCDGTYTKFLLRPAPTRTFRATIPGRSLDTYQYHSISTMKLDQPLA